MVMKRQDSLAHEAWRYRVQIQVGTEVREVRAVSFAEALRLASEARRAGTTKG